MKLGQIRREKRKREEGGGRREEGGGRREEGGDEMGKGNKGCVGTFTQYLHNTKQESSCC